MHLADLHLDTSFAGRTEELRTRLREALREAFRRAVEHAVVERVDAVLIAGDLFDDERLSFATERFLLEMLARLTEAGIPVMYATGNHDPGTSSGAVRRIEWPPDVTVFRDPEPRRVPVKRGDTTVGFVTGAGHASHREADDLSRRFPRPEGRLPEVALLHTQVLGAGGAEAHDRYAPSKLPFLRSAGFHYWALGHIHRPQALAREPHVHYPGNLQGRHFGEAGPRGGLLVDLDPSGRSELRFLELAPVRWEALEVSGLGGFAGLGALTEGIRSAWQEARARAPAPPGTEWLARVILRGPTPLYRELGETENLDELARELRATLGLLDVEVTAHGVHAPVNPAAHRGRGDVVGQALALLERVAGVSDTESPTQILGISPQDLAAGGDDPDAYLRELLNGQETALLEALLEPEGWEREA